MNKDNLIYMAEVLREAATEVDFVYKIATMKTRAQYYSLIEELKAIEAKLHVRGERPPYITDEVIDAQNTLDCAGIVEYSDEYWNMMYLQACSAAGQRCEEIGKDVNELIGRNIY